MTPRPVTLQISLSPSDFRHACLLLEHQTRTWRPQVAEILICVDFHRSKGRFSANWSEGREKILQLANSIEGARVETVDYGADAMSKVAAEFFDGREVPAKDFRGGPYYSYFFGLERARHPCVLHADSDILFGGGSRTWLGEALAHMGAHTDELFSAPLPGPPTQDGTLLSQSAERDPDEPYAFKFRTMSTRIFLMDRARFKEAIGCLCARRPPSLRNAFKALVERNPVQDLPEHLFTDAMAKRGLFRREFLGSGSGMWTLHPPYRSSDFYSKLPELIRRVEAGDVPAGQRGDHDLNSSMVDWSEAIAQIADNRWWRRLFRG